MNNELLLGDVAARAAAELAGLVPAPAECSAVADRMAAVAFAAIRELGLCNGEIDQPTWQVAPRELKFDYRFWVLRALEGSSPMMIHQRWLEHRMRMGWVWGAAFSADGRTHPMLTAWSETTAAQKLRIRLLFAIVGGMTVAEREEREGV